MGVTISVFKFWVKHNEIFFVFEFPGNCSLLQEFLSKNLDIFGKILATERELQWHSTRKCFIDQSILFIRINEIMNMFWGYFAVINEKVMITSYRFNGDIIKAIETFLPFNNPLIKCKRILWTPSNTWNVHLFNEHWR